MPYRFRKIDPREQEDRKAMGILFPFNPDFLFTQTYQTVDAYKSNLMDYFLTAKGDRYMNPGFGCSLLNFLFENYTEEKRALVEDQIRRDLQLQFPRLIINNLNLIGSEDENTVRLSMSFSIKDTGLNDELTVEFN